MGLRRLFGGRKRGSSWVRELPGGVEVLATLFEGTTQLEVVGEANYQEALEQIAGGRTSMGANVEGLALLIPEPENPYDPNAVGVWIVGKQVGYLSREHAAACQPAILNHNASQGRAVACRALIVGGWDRGGGDQGHFGVKLHLDAAELGLDSNMLTRAWTGTTREGGGRTIGPGTLDGKHYTLFVEDVKQLRREGREEEAESLLLKLVDVVEEEATTKGLGVAPWYYEQLAIIYSKRHNHEAEVAILERFESAPHAPGVRTPTLLERLNKARARVAKGFG